MTKTMKYAVLAHAAPSAPYRGASQTMMAKEAARPLAAPATDGQTRPTAAGRIVSRETLEETNEPTSIISTNGAAPENSAPRMNLVMGW